ncbi:MAG: T9SS type A sorting domain-containing protein [Bacteroidetes bacterium]|nr:T9SS type A sorting domain-containing protein [Bacteroidota bacterium]
MKIKSRKLFYIKSLPVIFLLTCFNASFAQVNLVLSMTDFFSWQPSTPNQANICNVPLHSRMKFPNQQLSISRDTNARVLYCPDGMNNFGPYIDSSNQFNLFNFSHWQYIDILSWFGGSAGYPVIVPAKPWVDAAHQNGVKVIGTVFLAPTAYGGTQAIVQNFLQQDLNGHFLAAAKLAEIANYYQFDGWLLNFETQVNSSTGALAAAFVHELDSAYSGEVIWYDALLANGNVSYQNRLNANNAYFFQNSTGIFTNYNWSSGTTVTNSGNYAAGLGRSPFDVYTGADMWPGRNAQTAFSDYTWIDQVFNGTNAKTSMALFATNFTFNYSGFSTFNTNPNDYGNFYSTERKIFSGLDQDPFTVDATWKGISKYIAVRSVNTSFPFETDFNTGHGLNYYDSGSILVPGAWHNMSHQSVLPSWTFYSNGLNIQYDFNDAYDGGSSLSVSSAAGGYYNIPLFSTCLKPSSANLSVELILKSLSNASIDSVAIEMQKPNGNPSVVSVFFPVCNGSWEQLINPLNATGSSDTLVAVALNIHASAAFSLNIGKIRIEENQAGSVLQHSDQHSSLMVFPNPSTGTVYLSTGENSNGEIRFFDLAGKQVCSQETRNGTLQRITLPGPGVYLFEYKSKNEFRKGKLVVHQ